MKKLFLFVLTAMMICSCSKSETEDNPNPNPESSVTGMWLTPDALTFESTGGSETVWLNLNYSGTSTNAQWKLTGGESVAARFDRIFQNNRFVACHVLFALAGKAFIQKHRKAFYRLSAAFRNQFQRFRIVRFVDGKHAFARRLFGFFIIDFL